jgi:stage II sporulation protein M
MLLGLRQNIRLFLRSHLVAFFFMVLFFIIGIVVGALAVKVLPDDQKAELVSYLHLFFMGLTQGGELTGSELIFSALANNIKIILLMWILGFTIIGIPFVVFLIFTRGFIVGFTVGFLVNEYVLRGLAFAFVSVLPHSMFSVPAVIITGVVATSFSWMLMRRKVRGKQHIMVEAVSYSFICFIMVLVMVLASLIEVYISPVFMKLVARFLINS